MKNLLRCSPLLLLLWCRREATTPPVAEVELPRCVPAPRRLCPADEAQSDPSFAAFRAQMISALDAKDATKLRAMIDPNVRTSFGGNSHFDDSLWPELSKALRLGGSFRDGMFWAPYVYSKWPENFDAFRYVAAINHTVPLHERAVPNVSIVSLVNWEILEVLKNEKEWLYVRAADGKQGWVRASDVRSPIAYRAGFIKENGAWKLNAFVSGD